MKEILHAVCFFKIPQSTSTTPVFREGGSMRIIERLNEIRMNTKTLDKYLDSKTDPEYSFAIDLVKRGICFVVVKENGVHRFYPSRFVGYADNCRDTPVSYTHLIVGCYAC